jgi:hypothetical protein
MVELNDHIIDEFGHRGSSMLAGEFLSLIERHHPTDGPGAEWDVVEAYANALDREGVSQLNSNDMLDPLEEKRRESGTWIDEDVVYELGDGSVSTYPADWHDRLGGERDIVEFVEALTDVDESIGRSGQGPGVPENFLLNVAAIVGGLDRSEAKAQLEDQRRDGPIAEDADQHPDARVRLE